MVREVQSASTSSSGPLSLHFSTIGAKQNDIMPASLTQVDISVLQQLPEELKADVLELLPAHRTSECSTEASLDYQRKAPHGSAITKKKEVCVDGLDLVSKSDHLWIGSPPKWVGKFEVSNCMILNTFAGFYYKSFPGGSLSSILQHAISSPLFVDLSCEEWDEAQCNFCQLLEQYIDLKMESDIEEIYICFQLLERCTWGPIFMHLWMLLLCTVFCHLHSWSTTSMLSAFDIISCTVSLDFNDVHVIKLFQLKVVSSLRVMYEELNQERSLPYYFLFILSFSLCWQL